MGKTWIDFIAGGILFCNHKYGISFESTNIHTIDKKTYIKLTLNIPMFDPMKAVCIPTTNFRTDGQTDKGKIPPPLKWGHKRRVIL